MAGPENGPRGRHGAPADCGKTPARMIQGSASGGRHRGRQGASVTIFQLTVLAVVQGITEFLPISSSAHLILVPLVFHWPDQGLGIDVAVHVGTLAAVALYFRGDLIALARGAVVAVFRQRWGEARPLALLVLATLPIVAAGFLLQDTVGTLLRHAEIIGWTSIFFGILLYVVDRFTLRVRRIEHMTWRHAALIGVLQVLALVPGTSRAGITMIGARMLGYERTEAARFSMLLSIPTIVGAGTLVTLDIAESGDTVLIGHALLAAGLSAATALAAIALLMAWLKHASFTPFVVYRVLLGVGILYAEYAL